MIKGNRVAVFGGSGFLGSHASDALTKAGYEVTIFDRIASPWIQDNQKMIVGDLLDKELIADVLSKIDIIYHFAGLSDLNSNLEQALSTAKINITGTVQLLEESKKAKIKRFIYASSMYVNSREGGFYRCSKQACEDYIQEFQKLYDLDFTILRFGSLYGPRSNGDNGLFRIMKEAINTGKLKYKGSPDTLREYIHVYDMAEACVQALKNSFKNEIIVLTGKESLLVKDVLFIIAEILNLDESNIEFEEGEYKGHYTRTPYSYKTKLGKKYNPEFSIDLGQGLLDLINYMKNN